MEPVAFLCVFVCVLEGNSDRYVRVSNGTPPQPPPLFTQTVFTASRHKTPCLLRLAESPSYLDRSKTHTSSKQRDQTTHTRAHAHTLWSKLGSIWPQLSWTQGDSVTSLVLKWPKHISPGSPHKHTQKHTYICMWGIYGMWGICLQLAFLWNSWLWECVRQFGALSSLCTGVCNSWVCVSVWVRELSHVSSLLCCDLRLRLFC